MVVLFVWSISQFARNHQQHSRNPIIMYLLQESLSTQGWQELEFLATSGGNPEEDTFQGSKAAPATAWSRGTTTLP